MNLLLESILFGFFGGIVRILVGILKLKHSREFKWPRVIITLVVSGIIGAFAALFVSTDYRLMLLAGYAGTDFIEGLYKIFKKKGFLGK